MDKENKESKEEIRKEVLMEIYPTIQFTIDALKEQRRILDEREKMIIKLAVNLFGYEAVSRVIDKL